MNMRLTVSDCISVGPKTDEGADNLNIMAMHRQRGWGGEAYTVVKNLQFYLKPVDFQSKL